MLFQNVGNANYRILITTARGFYQNLTIHYITVIHTVDLIFFSFFQPPITKISEFSQHISNSSC